MAGRSPEDLFIKSYCVYYITNPSICQEFLEQKFYILALKTNQSCFFTIPVQIQIHAP